MAVQEQTPLREYTANGVTTSFALGFDCEETNHLIVTIDDVEVLPTDWYLSGSNVIFWNAPGNGKLIKLQRNTPFNRLVDYQSYNNSFRPPAINKEFDRIWWKLQELGVADWILGARIDALKNYVDRKDDELKAYLMEEIRKQGVALDQLEEYYDYLMERLAQIAVDKGWDASFVVDGDKTQKQINDDQNKINNKTIRYVDNISQLRELKPNKNKAAAITLGFFEIGKGSSLYVFDESISASDNNGEYIQVSGISGAWVLQPTSSDIQVEQFGAVGDGVTSDAAAIRRASAYAEKYNLGIVGTSDLGYFIDSNCDIYNDLKLSHLVLSANPTIYGHLLFKTRKVPETINISDLSGLNEGSAKVTGFPLSAVGKYIRITSDAVFTERNNSGVKQYYYKNTTFNLLDFSGTISPSLDMGFSSADSPTVSIIPHERTMHVDIGKVSTRGGDLESFARIDLLRDSIEFNIGHVATTAQFRTLISNLGNNNKLYGTVADTNIDGLGYGVSIGNTCDTFIYDFKGSRGRTELDGRHGANVFVYNSKLKSAGSHWGNNYSFYNCEIINVVWSGKDLSFDGGVIHNSITSRTDLHLCIGRFYANNITHHGTVFFTVSGDIPDGFFSTPRRIFDDVTINNLKCTANISSLFGVGVRPLAEFKAPSHISIDEVYAPNATRLSLLNIPIDDALVFPKQQTLNISNIRHGGVCRIIGRGFTRNVSTFGYKATISNCGRIEIQCDSNYLQDLDVVGSEIVSARQINPKTALGRWIFNNCKIKRDNNISTSLLNTASPKGFINCEYDGDMSGISNLGALLFSIGCRATIGSTNYPTPLKAGYINPVYYIDDEPAI